MGMVLFTTRKIVILRRRVNMYECSSCVMFVSTLENVLTQLYSVETAFKMSYNVSPLGQPVNLPGRQLRPTRQAGRLLKEYAPTERPTGQPEDRQKRQYYLQTDRQANHHLGKQEDKHIDRRILLSL